MSSFPSNLYAHLEELDRDDPVESATYREQAQEILANPSIALKIRTAIADLLLQANQQLSLKNVGSEDSY
jgi:hypothetical protein